MEESSPVQHAVRGMQVLPQGRRVLSQNGRPFPSVVQQPCPQLIPLEHVHSPLTHATSELQVSQVPPLWPHACGTLPGSQMSLRQQPVVQSAQPAAGVVVVVGSAVVVVGAAVVVVVVGARQTTEYGTQNPGNPARSARLQQFPPVPTLERSSGTQNWSLGHPALELQPIGLSQRASERRMHRLVCSVVE